LKIQKGDSLGKTMSGTSAKFETLEILNPEGIPGALFRPP